MDGGLWGGLRGIFLKGGEEMGGGGEGGFGVWWGREVWVGWVGLGGDEGW